MVYNLRFLSSKCSLFHNSNLFGSCIIHILYTGCAKTNQIIPATKVNDHVVCGASCQSIVMHLSALHAVLFIVQVCTYKFREGYVGHKFPLLTV